jgi:AcrR family transcriptional regulator
MTGKERREQLLDVGRRLFAERGFEGTSIEEIAAQAGVSKPVVYEHFGGKEGLYAVVVDREVERLLTMTTSLLDGNHTRDKFEAAAVSLFRYIDDNADGFRILVRDSSPGPGSGTYGTLLSDIAGQVEYILADFLVSRGHDANRPPRSAGPRPTRRGTRRSGRSREAGPGRAGPPQPGWRCSRLRRTR